MWKRGSHSRGGHSANAPGLRSLPTLLPRTFRWPTNQMLDVVGVRTGRLLRPAVSSRNMMLDFKSLQSSTDSQCRGRTNKAGLDSNDPD